MNHLQTAPVINTETVLDSSKEIIISPTQDNMLPGDGATLSLSSVSIIDKNKNTATKFYNGLLHAVSARYQSLADKAAQNNNRANDTYQTISNINKLSELLSSFPTEALVSQRVYTNCFGNPFSTNLTAVLI